MSQSTETVPDTGTEPKSLHPFSGFLLPGVCFTSGYCVWLLDMESTPNPIESYKEVWVITPDDEVTLYIDPVEAAPYVELYHNFDRVVGADITWEQADLSGITAEMNAEDGSTLSIQTTLGSSTGTHLLNAITTVTPQPVLRTSIGESISNLSFGLLMDANGLNVAGFTDGQEPYRVEAETLRVITEASATLNDEDLGEVSPPDRRIEFGDAIVPNEPFVSFGELFLPFAAE